VDISPSHANGWGFFMRTRLVIQIDGGYLRAWASGNGLPYSNDLIQQVARQIVLSETDELLRVMYYDAPAFQGEIAKPVSRKPAVFKGDARWLDELAARERFAVRRGTVKWRGWKVQHPEKLQGAPSDEDYKADFQQKGVDLRIGVDMVTFAYERTTQSVLLLAGDTDFIPAMKICRRRGLEVIGLDLPGLSLSREFRQHVDVVRRLDLERLKRELGTLVSNARP
jgi:uncharacterized LabA/DUF88 family protein